MTQTQSAPPATVPAAPPQGTTLQAPNARTAGPRGAVAQWFAGTPGRMRAFLILAAAMSVVFGLAAAQGFSQSDGALDRAQANTAQLVRIQAIHTNLVSANADATNAFLVGGLEPPEQRAALRQLAGRGRRADRRGRDRAARGPRRARRAEQDADHVRRPDRAGPRQQPAGPPDRFAVPEGRELGAAGRLAAAGEGAGRGEREARRHRVRRDQPGHHLGPRRRPAEPGGLRDHAPLAGPPYAPLPQRPDRRRRRPRPADHRRRRGFAGQRVELREGHAECRVRPDVGAVAGPHRGVRRPLEREPDPDRPRLRRRLRQGVHRGCRPGGRATGQGRRRRRQPDSSCGAPTSRSTPRCGRPTAPR